MIDVYSTGGGDIQLFDTQVNKAANVLNTQLRSLEYNQDLGLDLNYFLSNEFKFQDASFNSYLIQVLAANGINVATMMSLVQNLTEDLTINLTPEETSSALVAR